MQLCHDAIARFAPVVVAIPLLAAPFLPRTFNQSSVLHYIASLYGYSPSHAAFGFHLFYYHPRPSSNSRYHACVHTNLVLHYHPISVWSLLLVLGVKSSCHFCSPPCCPARPQTFRPLKTCVDPRKPQDPCRPVKPTTPVSTRHTHHTRVNLSNLPHLCRPVKPATPALTRHTHHTRDPYPHKPIPLVAGTVFHGYGYGPAKFTHGLPLSFTTRPWEVSIALLSLGAPLH